MLYSFVKDLEEAVRHNIVFKQKTAYEILYGLVGSEMCIEDRCTVADPVLGS